MSSNITLLIGTCDKYSFLWDNFVTTCNRYWNIDCKKIFAGETLQVKHKRYHTSMCGRDHWTNIIRKTLDYVETDYTYFILDDYYLLQHINDEVINSGINFLQQNDDANKLVYTDATCAYYTVQHVRDKFYKMLDSSDYLTTTQPAIWKTSFLKDCLFPNMNPWQFEIDGTNLIKGKNNKVYISHTQDIYFNVVNKGQILPKWPFYKQMENLLDFNF